MSATLGLAFNMSFGDTHECTTVCSDGCGACTAADVE